MNEYADLALLKQQLAITDSARDDLLNAALSAASRSVDDYAGRRFYLDDAASARVYRPTNRVYDDLFLVDDIGGTDDLVVEMGSEAAGWTAVTANVELYPENAVARAEAVTGLYLDGASWLSLGSTERVRVTARWGWPAVPDQIVEATLILATRLYKRKDSPEGVLGSAEWGTVRLSRTDPDVAELVSRFVLLGFA